MLQEKEGLLRFYHTDNIKITNTVTTLKWKKGKDILLELLEAENNIRRN